MITEIIRSNKKNLGSPDAVKEFAFGKLENVAIGGMSLSRITLQPGWKWSEHVRPLAQTDSCQTQHIQYVISGKIMVQMDDGQRIELGAGDFVVLAPGHDAWVVGDEPFVAVDFSPDMKFYAHQDNEGRS